MKVIDCPLNGRRNVSEFVCAGVVIPEPDPATCSDAEWADHIFLRENEAGLVREWWLHVPTAYWFIAERNTVTDEIVRTYPASDIFNARRDYAVPPKNGGAA
jgi:sarcosine oxidase subunit delta